MSKKYLVCRIDRRIGGSPSLITVDAKRGYAALPAACRRISTVIAANKKEAGKLYKTRVYASRISASSKLLPGRR